MRITFLQEIMCVISGRIVAPKLLQGLQSQSHDTDKVKVMMLRIDNQTICRIVHFVFL